MDKHIVFIGLSGYEYPHTRVRCYHFAQQLDTYPGIRTHVISFKDHLSSLTEVETYMARDRQKMTMIARALPRIFPRLNTYFYIQKAHYNSALPFLLNRLGFNRYLFDYDDYDVDLTVTFNRMRLRRFFYGSDDHAEITRRLITRALGCIAASRSLYEYVGGINPRVEYISTGVRTEQFTVTDRSSRTGPVHFIWNGIIWGDEIYESVLRIFHGIRAVLAERLDVRLELVGGGQLWDQTIDALQREFSDITGHVNLTGWVHPDEMPGKLAAADVGLLPFASDSMWVRSKSPTKLFEYMASGLPVIADAVGEVRHVIESGVSGILAANQDDMNRAMID
ncbi:glycosyltransferase family 4 protein, partial [bacterium]|nr:glycosyltransferase family 4 protein [candidate division CSSED10-310 bacterium]